MDQNEGQIVNFERICRLCLHEKHTLTDIFEPTTDNNNYSIDQKIMACATIDLSKGDGLPSRICVKCLSSVNAAFDFRVQCENADKTLHILHNLMVNETDKDKSDKAAAPVDAIIEEENEEAEKNAEKEKIDLEQIILVKKEDNAAKLEGDNQNLYYIIKDNEGGLMEGILSDAEIIYFDNGSSSELSTADSAEGKVAAETEEVEVEKEVLEDEEEEEEEEEEAQKPEAEAKTKAKVKTVEVEVKNDSTEEKSYKLLVKSPADEPASKKSQMKTLKKTGEDLNKSPCPFCNKMLTRVDEHVRLMHRNRVYICNKMGCGAQFATLKNLQSHQLTCYDVEKAYKCPYCFKEFHRKSNHKAHVRRHNNKKEFQCQLCDSAFVDTTGLRRHFLKHHEPEREIFVSNCCGKRFKSKEGLKKHINKRICGIQVLQVVDPSPIEVPM